MATEWEIGDEIETITDGRKRIESLIPGVRVTSEYRSKNHPLSRKNPNSNHIEAHDTIDVAPIKGMTFDDYLSKIREGGYEILEAKDEATNPIKGLTTGPHWHVRIAANKAAQEVNQPQWEIGDAEELTAPVAAPAARQATAAAPQVIPEDEARGFGDRFLQAFKGNAQYGFPGLVARKVMDWTDYGMGELKKLHPNATAEELETLHEQAIAEAQKTLRDNYEAETSKDPAWRPDESWVDNILSARWAAAVPGIMLGQAGPEMALAPGAGPVGRILSQGAINAGADLGYQGLDIADGVAEEIDPLQVAISGAAGMGFQGGSEVIGAIAKRLGGRVVETNDGPQIAIKQADGTETVINPAALQEEVGLTGVVTDTSGDGPVLSEQYGRPDVSPQERQDIQWEVSDDAPTADIIPFPTKEPAPVRNPNEPIFLVPENENAGGSRAAQQPKPYERQLGRDEVLSRVDGSGKEDTQTVRSYTQAEAEQLIRDRLGVEPTKQANDNFTEVPVYKRAAQDIGNPDNLNGPNGRGKAKGIPNPDELDNMKVRTDPNSVVRPRTEAAPAVTVQLDAKTGKITPKTPKVSADAKVGTVRPTAKAVGNYVADVTKGWKNGPDIHVVQKVDQLPDGVRESVTSDGKTKSPAFFGADGKVYMIADNIKHEGVAKAAIFHEALGHAGLANKFREDLDTFLTHAYDTNTKFAGEVDNWMSNHKGAYGSDTVRAAEEVLAIKSNKGLIDQSLRNRLSAYIRKWLRDLGLNMKISNRELQGILELAQKTVTDGKKTNVSPTANKYIDEDDIDGIEEPKYIGNLNIEKIKTNRPQVRQLLEEIAKDIEETNGKVEPLTHDEILDFAASTGTTYKKLQKMDLTDPKVVYAFRQHFTRTAEKAADLSRKSVDETLSGKERTQLFKTMMELADMQETLQGVARNAGRMLNQFKLATTGTEFDVKGALKYMSENGFDEAGMNKVAEAIAVHKGNPAAVQKVARDLTKPYWEDYITSVRYQFMLSGLGTHARNFAGNLTMMALDTLEHGAAAVGGQFLRFSKNPRDRIAMREVLFRVNGMIKALADAKTYRDTVQAFKDGKPTYHVNKMLEDNMQGRILSPEGSKLGWVTEYSKNLLAAGDQFFRPIIENGHINGYAFRQAFQEGVNGYKHITDRAYEIMNDQEHGKRIREKADQQTAELQLIGENSPLGKVFSSLTARKPEMNGVQRAYRFAVTNMFPFARVNDNLLKAALRRNVLFGWMDSDNRRLWATGDAAERSLVASRIILGTAITGALGHWAMTGALEKDSLNRTSLFGVPLEGLDAVGKSAAVIAGLVKQYKEGSIKDEEYTEGTFEVFGTLVKELMTVSAMDSVGNLFEALAGGSTAESYTASLASSFVNPAIVRQSQEFLDPKVRDQTEDGTLVGRTEGKVKGVWNPQSLPVRHDELGREQDKPGNLVTKAIGIGRSKPEETEAAALALKELGGVDKVVGMPKKYVTVDGERIDMNSEQHQKFIQISGTLIKDTLNRDIQTPEWKAASAEEKKKWVRDIRTEARKAAKEELFSQTQWEIE